jgi:hypothetical protein
MSNPMPRIHVDDFLDEDFLKEIAVCVHWYARFRVQSVQSHLAFRRVFGPVNCDNNMYERIQNLECSIAYTRKFAEILEKTPIDKILNAKRAVHAYLDLAFNPNTRDASKVSALKEATVLAGITVLDEDGQTRLGNGMADFYAAQQAARHETPVHEPVADEPHIVH